MSFHQRLEAWRAERGMSREELAIQMDVSAQTIGRYERGERSPRAEDLARLAELGCDMNWLFTGVFSTSQEQSQSMPAAPERQAAEPEPEPAPAPEGAWAPRADVGPIVRISIAVEGVYRDLAIPIAAHEITRIAVEKYNELLDVVEDDGDWPGAIKMMANGLRKELLAAPSATSSTKQRA